MKILKRDEFKKLLKDNPGQKFAFYEYEPCCFMSGLHITMGDADMPTFGAWSPSPVGTEVDDITGSDSEFEDFYDWNLMEDSRSQQYAILEDTELNFFEQLLSECNYISLKRNS